MTRCVHLAWVIATVLAALTAGVWAQGSEFRAGQWQETAAPAEGTAAGELALIRMYCDAGQFYQAIKAAKRFLKLYDAPAGREEAMLLAGEAEMGRDRLFQGYEWFEKQLAEYPGGRFSNRALEREFEVAEGFLAGKKRVVLVALRLPARDDGLEILSRIAEHAPGTDLAQRALMRIGDDHFERAEWADAVEAYDRYLTAFPEGDKAAEAMLKAAQATFRSFTGVGRDETPLIEAEQRYREYIRKFPISASGAAVEATLEQIRLIRATKLLAEGRFYERIGKPTAAAFTYRRVIDIYPHTDAADQAQLALTTLEPQASPAPTSGPAEVSESFQPLPLATTMPTEPATQPSATTKDLEPIDLEKLPASTAPARESP